MTTHADNGAPEGAILVDCTHERHADQILAIFNEAIVTSTALYDYKPRPREAMQGWFQAKRGGGFPVVGYENAAGELMAFASSARSAPGRPTSIRSSIPCMSTAVSAGRGWARR